jgi:glycolate oxidase FAD binding subunit
VSGYDVPKLVVGSLGTLGVIVEATLRLHPTPAASGSWLVVFPSHERAAAFDARLLGSALEPDRVVLLNGGALAGAGQPASPAAVAVSVGSVEEAVRSQAARLRDLAAESGGEARPVSADLWEALGAGLEGEIVLRLAGEPRRLAAWVSEIERAAARLGLEPAVAGEVSSGTARAALRGSPAAGAFSREVVDPLRAALLPEGGSLVVERCPTEMKSAVDVWGPVPPDRLAIMRRIKAEFDPGGTLNPGRFVGGL